MSTQCATSLGKVHALSPKRLTGRSVWTWLLGLGTTLTACAPTPTPPAAPTVPIVLISLDTLRWDHVGAMIGDDGLTPNLNAVAADGVSFRAAIAQASWTLPSHASVFTGQYPSRHGVNISGASLDQDRSLHVAARLTEGGYISAAFVNKGFWRHEAGLDHGFETTTGIPTARFPDEIGEWIQARTDRPFFLFVHNFGVTAFDAPKISLPHLGEFGRDLPAFLRHFHDTDIPEDVEARIMPTVRERYRLGVKSIDGEVGRLVAWLRDAGLYDACAIVIFSDHGTELGEHGRTYHGHTVYDELIRVPLIIKLPDNRHAGQMVDRPVRLLDIYPTILEIAGLYPRDNAAIDGVDLRPLMEDPTLTHPPAVSEVHGAHKQIAIRTEDTKVMFVESFGNPGIVTSRHFDLEADPAEQSPIAGTPEGLEWAPTLSRALGRPIEAITVYGNETAVDHPHPPSGSGPNTR